jgi:hypothetical protein
MALLLARAGIGAGALKISKSAEIEWLDGAAPSDDIE